MDTSGYFIRLSDDYDLLAELYHRHWLAMGVSEADVRADWREAATAFMQAALDFSGFTAHLGDRVVGGVCCHAQPRPYPPFVSEEGVKEGYVWSLYVERKHRGQGLGARLLGEAVAHLRAAGCGRIRLHSGAESARLYARAGFNSTGEMALRP